MKTKELNCPKCKNTFLVDYSERMPPPYSAKCPSCNFKFKFYLSGEILQEKRIKKIEEFVEIKTAKIVEKIVAPIKTEMKRVEEEFKIEEANVVEKKAIDKPTIAGALLVIVFILGIFTSFLISTYGVEIFQVEKRDASIYGSVLDEVGYPIEGVRITVSKTGDFTLTNKQGLYFIYGLEEGNYDIIASKDGFIPIVKKVTLKGGDNNIMFVLKKGNESEEIVDERTGINTIDNLKIVNTTCISLIIVFSIIALIAGIFAFQRKKFWLSLTGSAFGITSAGLIFIGPLLSVIAFFLILFSRREFRS